MASVSKTSELEIPDNHRESWQALLAAAAAYSQKSGCDLAILTACKKFLPSGADAAKKREGGGVMSTGSRRWDYGYHVWGQGALAEASRRYLDDIGVLHSTTVLTAQRHARLAIGEGGAKLAVDIPSERPVSGLSCKGGVTSSEQMIIIFCLFFKISLFTPFFSLYLFILCPWFLSRILRNVL